MNYRTSDLNSLLGAVKYICVYSKQKVLFMLMREIMIQVVIAV